MGLISITAALLLLSPLILLLPLDSAAAASGTAVLDVDGQKLQTATNYYILPVLRGRGGGLALGLRNKTCPFYVAQDKLEVSNGIPVKFFPTNSTDKAVEISMDMNIVFSASTICVQSTAWTLGGVDEATQKRYVKTGGMVGNPGASTVSNWFRIDKGTTGDYKLVFCPSVCSFCRVICGDLGVFFEEGQRFLGLSDAPLAVMFKKA